MNALQLYSKVRSDLTRSPADQCLHIFIQLYQNVEREIRGRYVEAIACQKNGKSWQ